MIDGGVCDVEKESTNCTKSYSEKRTFLAPNLTKLIFLSFMYLESVAREIRNFSQTSFGV